MLDYCPVCNVPFDSQDMCLTDIELGTCHAGCLEGSPMVDLETGEELPEDAPMPQPYKYEP